MELRRWKLVPRAFQLNKIFYDDKEFLKFYCETAQLTDGQVGTQLVQHWELRDWAGFWKGVWMSNIKLLWRLLWWVLGVPPAEALVFDKQSRKQGTRGLAAEETLILVIVDGASSITLQPLHSLHTDAVYVSTALRVQYLLLGRLETIH